ncbi:hypothetical protein QFC20_006785 [Naganishia adeliensis]|uniref:Uncharacterized protein n=1 Tax=Naganishia adeliensis TaxID=92952 RepID=A0ACC2V7B2_9TREE|nr:hypothetical protein QFC20_006785 [Naganishia adeliensis]
MEKKGGLDLMSAKAELTKHPTDSLPEAMKTILTDKLFMEEFGTPDKLPDKETSSDFRALVLELCMEQIVGSGSNITLTEDQVNEIIAEVDTYWDNIRREYGNQMQASKRLKRKHARAKDRRRARQDRTWNEMVDKMSHSPLGRLSNAEWFRASLCGEYSWLPDLLSEDEEDRFIKRADLNERMIYYLECTRRPRQYKPDEIWESREAFWMTFECRQAGILLDEYVRKMKPSITPVFRGPYNLLQKNMKKAAVWPKIREHDGQWNPDHNGDGFVIYRSMVCHDRIRECTGYVDWQKQLYPDPPAANPSTSTNGANGTEIVYPTLKEACESDEFKDLGLWNELTLQYEQVRANRAKEPELLKRYNALTATVATVPVDQNDDDEEVE